MRLHKTSAMFFHASFSSLTFFADEICIEASIYMKFNEADLTLEPFIVNFLFIVIPS